MNFFENIVGNHALTERLTRDIKDGLLSHAYILEGPRGSGRNTIALTAAAAISCQNRDKNSVVPCLKCPNCKKIMSGQSPDIFSVSLEDDKAFIGIEAIRNIKGELYTAANDLDVKIYIINDADKLTLQAQNAFLLSLEEPPEYVLFFLICENSVSLLETIRSRAPTFRTERISNFEIEKYILSNDARARELKDSSPEDFKTLICVSNGSIGYALELLDARRRKQVFDNRRVAINIVSLLSDANRKAIFETIVGMGSKRQEISRQIVFLQYALRDLILLKRSDDVALCLFEDRDNASELATHFTSKSLIDLYDATTGLLEDLERNANVRVALISMMQNANLI